MQNKLGSVRIIKIVVGTLMALPAFPISSRLTALWNLTDQTAITVLTIATAILYGIGAFVGSSAFIDSIPAIRNKAQLQKPIQPSKPTTKPQARSNAGDSQDN